jgi:acetyl esterase/lipase
VDDAGGFGFNPGIMRPSTCFTAAEAQRRGGCAILALLVLALCSAVSRAGEPPAPAVRVVRDIAYKSGERLSDYEKQRCKLDLYLPAGKRDFPTVVWFHGGGLTEGGKGSPDKPGLAHSLAEAGIAMAAVNYRLSPMATYPAYIEDAAAAFAWTRAHIAEHGGNANAVFISGHSAGGYLTLMVGMDEHYLRDLGVEPSAIAGLIPISGQTMTHYTVRAERGIASRFTVIADQAAPVFHVRKDTPPMLVLYADHDMVGRAEENQYLVAMMQGAGNKRVTGMLVRDRDHGTIASRLTSADDPARLAILQFIQAQSSPRQTDR